MRALILVLAMFMANVACAGPWVNTNGSDDAIAIQGYDSVAFFKEGKAVKGRPEFRLEWQGGFWLFSSAENLELFKQDPERWAPQYGGHCALGVSEGYISKKPTSGQFEIHQNRLYLFPNGTQNPFGARNDWRRYGGPDKRVSAGDQNWPAMKAELLSQP